MKPADLDAVDFVAATPRGSEATVFSCPLCGGRFSHGQQVCSA